ncbi:SIR2 family NAD-dependent protein deacylase [Terrabacter sp. 2RAF25]|uniref:SIR2 family NAD-dependent protein deacylase n=1 Tax=Terrabacter sp. 2RAF25 TaxID=3232998 RepID=UPI003F9D2A09
MVVPQPVLEAAVDARRVVVVTGAGMSAESGVPTFRDAQTGLWEQYAAEDLATPEAWERDPAFVWAWYLSRFGAVAHVQPNAGHLALARWAGTAADGARSASVRVVTQNIDDLHERAGSHDVVHLHGSLTSFRCERCETAYAGSVDVPEQPVERVDPPTCPRCGGLVRPGVVWFGELLPLEVWEQAVALVEDADLVLVVGTSGIVHPAAGLPVLARGAGAVVVEVNPLETDVSDVAHVVWRETAALALPALVAEVEARRGQD